MDVVSVAGDVTCDDTAALLDAVRSAAGDPSRGVLVDLRDVTELHPVAAAALRVLSVRPALGLWLDVECGPQGPGQARRAVAECAARLGLEAVVDDLLLVVSELVTNAVRYGTAPLRLTLRRCSTGLSVGVHDGLAPPMAGAALPDDDAESGRGLVLVQAVADETGVRPEGGGKVVWARFSSPPATVPLA